MLNILKQIAVTGLKSEPAPAPADDTAEVARLQADILRILGRALTIRQVDAGSCNACELEIHALGNPYYNIEGIGIRFVASPRHADMLLVTGPVSIPFIGFFVSDCAYRHHSTVIGPGRDTSPNSTGGRT